MGEIYRGASLVVANPGHYRHEASVEDGDGFECPGLKGDFESLFHPGEKDAESSCAPTLPEEEDMKAMIHSLRQKQPEPDSTDDFPQEARKCMLPRVLRIGTIADEFRRAMHLIPDFGRFRDRLEGAENSNEHGGSESDGEPSMSRDEELSSTQAGKPDLELLQLLRTSRASDPRDKVYAVIGLAKHEIARSIIPDYSPRNTASQLFIDVASRFIQAGFGAEVLSCAGLDQRLEGLPSWVPDWTLQSRSELATDLYRCGGEHTSPTISMEEVKGRSCLSVRGVVLAKVEFFSAGWRCYSHDKDLRKLVNLDNNPKAEMPDLNDEDSRNILLAIATGLEERSGFRRYKSEEWESVLSRTLTGDCFGQSRTGISKSRAVSCDEDTSGSKTGEIAAEFRDSFQAYRQFYARGPTEDDDMERVRIHQTGQWMWIMGFDREMESDLQKRLSALLSRRRLFSEGAALGFLRLGMMEMIGAMSRTGMAKRKKGMMMADFWQLFRGTRKMAISSRSSRVATRRLC
ncbi:hypothetical protein GGR57DRAFT_476246 [Xylariaceae sp. FL1272]|nr:hypothetical protein GGR57DRAFT_476246 [Xylariaceae sp. FL1272]